MTRLWTDEGEGERVAGLGTYARRGFLRACGVALATFGTAQAARALGLPARCEPWRQWEDFKRTYISRDGRVIDVGSPREQTVSEGQAYGLFFALVADDRPAFDLLLQWTENNLARGDLSAHLPAWLWGRGDDGRWSTLDAHSASDADLWLAYTLVEAGHIWNERRFTALGCLVARRIVSEETALLPGLGLTLLPGPVGFTPSPDTWRLNPSYVPLQVVRRLSVQVPPVAGQPHIGALARSSETLVVESAPRGFSPDWVIYRAGQGFSGDSETHAESAYNAIRVYLWAGMLSPRDPACARILGAFRPLVDYVRAHGYPPEKVDTQSGEVGPNAGPPGFSAAVAPYLDALGEHAQADAQMARASQLATQAEPSYYGHVLWLFALGWRDGRYRFAADGALQLPGKSRCHGPVR